ncbi:DUF2378 family protein [Aggregicoccus sp. 17bor-14]|uniref:DUF2378 family protein n=1 Tax=Myxococcaceae TaxID=31 RepID=UPI00351A1048
MSAVGTGGRKEPRERLTYGSVVEGLLRHGLQGQVPPGLRARLQRIGVDVERPLLPAYPLPVWLHCLWAIIEELYPGQPPEQAFRALGARTTEGYSHTLVGRAIGVLTRMLGPRRTVLRIPQLLASTDNWSRVEVLERGPCHFELWHNAALGTPGYLEGVLEALLREAGAKEPRARALELGEAHTLYELRWGDGLTRAPG